MTSNPVARVVFDPDGRADRLPLYADGRIEVLGRHSARVARGETTSFASYFNAFPAWHWRAFTKVREVFLSVAVEGAGELTVWRSDAGGAASVVDRRAVSGSLATVVSIDLDPNETGGWLWFDLEAHGDGLVLTSAQWEVDAEATEPRLATLSMTTMDKADFALGVLTRLAGEPAALAALDEVIVVDQGLDKVADHPSFEAATAALGGRLRVIEQPNLGGSGGFARGMLEVADRGRSGSIILLDDDVELEPESVARAVTFNSYTTAPTIVGGHFFDLHRPRQLHAFNEAVSFDDFDWGPIGPSRHDFGEQPLRATPWLHAPTRPDYNGWWFCLIPVEIIERIGLSLPAFLKWDDAEFGLRAAAVGFATVTLPGMAVWHVTWLDKNDSLGWQSFYHARNRLMAALVDERAPGRRLPRTNLALDVRFLVSMDYHVVELRHLAYESIFSGPETMHAEIGSRLAEVREVMRRFPSGVPVPVTGDLPPTGAPSRPAGALRLAVTAARLVAIQWFASGRSIPDEPQARIASAEARWWQVGGYRHVLAVASDGSSYQRHRLDPALLRRMLRRAIGDYRRMRRGWTGLGARYRSARPELVGVERWRETLGLQGDGVGTADPAGAHADPGPHG